MVLWQHFLSPGTSCLAARIQQGCGATGALIYYWGEYKIAQPLWKTVSEFLTKLNTLLPYNPAITLLGIFLNELKILFIVVQSLSHVWLCDSTDCSMPGSPALPYLPELAPLLVHWVSDAIDLIICCPLVSLPSVFPSIRVFSNELALCIRWPKYWNFSFDTSPSNEYSGMISFRIDWFDLLAVQGTLKSPLQHHNLKASVLWCSAFFMVQLSHLYMTAGKTTALTIGTFVGKVMLKTYVHTKSRQGIVIVKQQDPMVLSHYVLCLTLWENLNQRISLIKEMRKYKNKGKHSNKTKY